MSERRELPYDVREIRKKLQGSILSLLPELGFDLKRYSPDPQGRVYPLNPMRNDRKPGSFVIWTRGEGIGAWKDYATDARGDVFDLIRGVQRLTDFIDAYWWALEFLNLDRGGYRSASDAAVQRERAEADRKAAEKRAAGLESDKAAKAFAMWLACERDIRGTAAWTYLTEGRGLPLEALGRTPGALRFASSLEHVDADGVSTDWPAMVSCMSHQDDGKVRGIHRTYLAADGLGKAPVDKAKKMWGAVAGCSIRVWKGETGLSREEAARQGKSGPLIITEGIEDALTAACAQPAYRVEAAGSLSLLGLLDWPECASAVVLVADNDWDKPQAVAAFEKTLARWKEQAKGRPLKVVRAQAGKDLNDWARAG